MLDILKTKRSRECKTFSPNPKVRIFLFLTLCSGEIREHRYISIIKVIISCCRFS